MVDPDMKGNLGLFVDPSFKPLLEAESEDVVDVLAEEESPSFLIKLKKEATNIIDFYELLCSRLFEATSYIKHFHNLFPKLLANQDKIKHLLNFEGRTFDVIMTESEKKELDQRLENLIQTLSKSTAQTTSKDIEEYVKEGLYHLSLTYQSLSESLNASERFQKKTRNPSKNNED